MAEGDPARRGMQNRGIATRAALLNSAFECLVDLGFSATTTTEIAKRAGVSRGAQLHHFPTKEK
ncbi:MAG: TetR/AcrR family transcriptional regulator, partial [Acidimicrobiales bacterium]